LRVLIWIAILALFAFAFYLVLGTKQPPPARQMPMIPVTTGTAQKGNIGVYLDAIGTVTPVYTASITSQVTGAVTSVNYQEGQVVTQGSSLVDIDSRPYAATLLQAQGILERDENVLAQAQMDLERYQAAWARNAVARQTLDDQEKIVKQDEGTVKNDQGVVAYDQVQVEYCHITAPFTGVAGLRLVDPGNLVSAGGGNSSSNPLVVITQLQPITVIFTIAEDSLEAVQARLRAKATLLVDAYDRSGQKKLASGQLLALDNQIDTTTGTLKLRAIFKNDDLALFPNQFVNTRLLVQTLPNVTLVPSSTIQQNGQTSYVYVIQDGVAHEQTVQPGVTDNGVTQVDGINPGDVIANSSFDKLQDNAKVVIAGPPGSYSGHGGHGGDGGHGAWSQDGSSAGSGSPGAAEGGAEPGHSPRAGHSPHHHHTPAPDQ
jgi:multidrug efflux system membrane fusion protein